MTAGRRNTLVTFERATVVQDDYGEETQTWDGQGQEWAAIFWGRGDERRQAAAEQGQQAASFEVLANTLTSSIGVKDRIIGAGSIWDIIEIAPDTPKRGEIRFTAIRAL